MTMQINKVIRSIYFKLLVIFVSAFVMVLFFVVPLSRFNCADPLPDLKAIDVKAEKEFGIFKTRVATGLFIQNFSHFDMIKNNFVLDLIVWFEFNSDEAMLDLIGKFSFENGKIIEKSLPDVRVFKERTFVKYTVRVELNTRLNYYKFPLEDHRFVIVLTNNFFTPREVVLNVNNTAFVVAPKVFVANWSINRLKTNYGYYENVLDQVDMTKKTLKPVAVFMIDFAKQGIRKTFVIFIPIFIAFFLALFSFCLVLSNFVGRVTLSVSSVSALLGYRFVIENIMPKVGYFTTTDHVYIILLALAFLIFIFQTWLVSTVMSLEKKEHVGKELSATRIDLARCRLRLANDVVFVIIVGLVLGFVGFVVVY